MKVTRTEERAKEDRVSVKTIPASVIVVMTPLIFHKVYSGKNNNKKKRKEFFLTFTTLYVTSFTVQKVYPATKSD